MRTALDNLFSADRPLGPNATPTDFYRSRNKNTFSSFFDNQNFLSKEVLESHPSAILGRRGAGKTAYLYHIRFEGGFTVVAKMESSAAFAQVTDEINSRVGGAESAQGSLVENSARIWHTLIFSTVICSVYAEFRNDSRLHDSDQVAVLKGFLQRAGLINLKLYHRVFRAIIKLFETTCRIKYQAGEDFQFLSDFIDGHFRDEIGFDDACDAMEDLLQTAGARALVLIDSLEQFPIHRYDMRSALAGLLHFTGELDRRVTSPVTVCMCLPAELHEEFATLSDNSAKDFERVVTLHWDTVELYQMSGHRFCIFLQHFRDVSGVEFEPLPGDPTREEVWNFWAQFLPRSMKNRLGMEEDSISYITRHTQLLPRQLIHLLNKIVILSLKRETWSFPFSDEDIIKGVRLGEGDIASEVFNGFKQKYYYARDVCKLILPNMPSLLTYPTLAKLNIERGRGIVKDTSELLEMLIRMGILGRLDEVTDRYARCRFDYTYNGQMPFSLDDHFGLHPAFSGQFRGPNWTPKDPDNHFAIYPIEQFSGERPGVGSLQT